MDLLKHLSKAINFTYSLALSPDGQFGNYIIRNLTQPGAKKEWTGLIGAYTCPVIAAGCWCLNLSTYFNCVYLIRRRIGIRACRHDCSSIDN